MSKNNHSTNRARRKLILAIAGTGAISGASGNLPSRWTDPVVDSVILPAHAQTSETTPLVFGGAGLEVAHADSDGGTRLAGGVSRRVIDAIISTAHAVQPYPPTSTVCAVPSGNMLDVTLQRSANNIRRQGMLSTDGTPGTLDIIATADACEDARYDPKPVDAYVSDFDADAGFNLHILRGETQAFVLRVPIANGCPEFAPLDGLCNGESDA